MSQEWNGSSYSVLGIKKNAGLKLCLGKWGFAVDGKGIQSSGKLNAVISAPDPTNVPQL